MGKATAKRRSKFAIENDLIPLDIAHQARVYDLAWRFRDAIERRDWRAVKMLQLELLANFDLNDRGLVAGRKLYGVNDAQPSPEIEQATLTDAEELALLRAMWGDDGEVSG